MENNGKIEWRYAKCSDKKKGKGKNEYQGTARQGKAEGKAAEGRERQAVKHGDTGHTHRKRNKETLGHGAGC